MVRGRTVPGLCALALGVLFQGIACADLIQLSQSGTFLQDDAVQTFTFTLTTKSTVEIQSEGYGGGTHPGGTDIQGGVVLPGGFATALWLFDPAGSLIADDNTGGVIGACSGRRGDPTTNFPGLCLDAFVFDSSRPQLILGPGSYTIALTQQGNDLNGTTLASGFSQTGNYTGGPFIDPFGNQRNGNWEVDIIATDTPEPSALLMAMAGLAAVSGIRVRAYFRRKK